MRRRRIHLWKIKNSDSDGGTAFDCIFIFRYKAMVSQLSNFYFGGEA